MDNPQLELAYNFVAYTDKNIFLTGKAGTGKTTFLHTLKKRLPKRMIVVAPTGVAAIHAGGVTIHSFFQLAFGPLIPHANNSQTSLGRDNFPRNQDKYQRFSKQKTNIMRSLDLLIIDEISMVRADLLDGIDETLRRVRRSNKPFGGVQVLMIGDLQQLAPVVKDDEWNILREFYDTVYFFSSIALAKSEFVGIELNYIYRQSDEKFIHILNRVRTNDTDNDVLTELNKRYLADFNPADSEGYITLTTHNNQAHGINDLKMQALPGESHCFKAEIEADFPEFQFPNDFELSLKVDAQVMFIKNDISQDKLYYNGKIGKISQIIDDTIFVQCPGESQEIPVVKTTWHNTKYTIDEETKDIKETIIGSFTQYPLKAAWAITIHKSQGLTFEKAIIDANASFAHGQVYVALSRCKSLEGLILKSKITPGSIKNDLNIYSFSNSVEQNQPDSKKLAEAQHEYELKLLLELFDFAVLDQKIKALQKQLIEHKESFLPLTLENLNNLIKKATADIFEVSTKFKVQISQLYNLQQGYSSNTLLQQRVKKATEYFLPNTTEILQYQFNSLDFECDNNTILKSLNETMEVIQMEVQIKLDCLRSSKKGFAISDYLTAKAISSITQIPGKKPGMGKQKTDHTSAGKPSPLFNILRKWRNEVAYESDSPVYAVMPQKTLISLSEIMPDTKSELKKIKGLGKRRIDFFGDEILTLIKQYKLKNHIDIPEHQIESYSDPLPSKRKTDKPGTIMITLDLLKEGKSISEVAALRNYTISTIGNHVGQLISKGLVDIRSLMQQERIHTIASVIIENPNTTNSEIMQLLEGNCTWEELRWVRNHLIANEML